MSFPQSLSTPGGNSGGNTTSHTVLLPGSIQAGDLLIAMFGTDGTPTVTFPGGWTTIFSQSNGFNKLVVAYRFADGSEGGSISVTTSSSEGSAHTVYQVRNHDSGNPPEVAAVSDGSSTNPNPGSLSPSGGAKDYLWLAVQANDDGTRSVSSYPSSYSGGRNDRWSQGQGVGVGSAHRSLNAASEDPGTFTLSGSTSWLATTLAVFPPERTATDLVSTTDAVVGSAVFGRNAADAVTVTDSTLVSLVGGVSVEDSVAVSDSILVSTGTLTDIGLNDVVDVTDAVAFVAPLLFSDAVSVTDQVIRTATFAATNSDFVSATDSSQLMAVFGRILSDTATVSDNLLEEDVQVRSLQDAVAVTDFISVGIVIDVELSDVVGVTDASVRSVVFNRTVANGVVVDETLSLTTNYVRSVADVVTAADLNQPSTDYRRTRSDTASVTDAVQRTVTFERSAGPDTVAVTDFTIEEDFEHRHLNDVVAVMDAVTAKMEFERLPADTVAVTELFRKEADYFRTQTDVTDVTDNTIESDFYTRSLTDTVVVTDNVVASTSYVRALNDLAGVTDDLLEADVALRRLQDEVMVTELLWVITDYVRPLTDVVAATDSMGPEVGKAASDSVGVTDSLQLTTQYHRLPADVAGVTDLVRPSTQYVRPTNDSVVTSDVSFAGTTRDVVGFGLPVTVCFGAGQTGLRPLIEILDETGAVVVPATQAGVLELGGGCYGVMVVIPANLFSSGDCGWIRLRRNPADLQPEVIAFELPTALTQPRRAFTDRVLDDGGNPVPRATIQVFKLNTSTLIFQTQADEQGSYLIPITADALLVPVDLEFSAPGTQALRKSAVKLSG